MPEDMFFVYCYNKDGRYGSPIQAEELNRVKAVKSPALEECAQ